MRSRKALSDPGLRVFWRLPAFNSAAARAAAAFRERLDRGELFLGTSRRSFFSRAFSLGGFAVGYAALQGLGLTSSAAARPRLTGPDVRRSGRPVPRRRRAPASGPRRGAERPPVIDWNRQAFNLGPWIHWEADGNDPAAYRLLGQSQGRVLLSGAHLSQLPSWQEGGAAAARRTVGLIADRVRADHLTPAHS
jgi:hypothetical protein